MTTNERWRSGLEVKELYNHAFELAEFDVNRQADVFDQTAIDTVLTAARRVGRVMQLEFPTVSQTPWICADIEITNESRPTIQDITPILQFVESTIWAYQPVWTVFADATYLNTGKQIDREEIEIVALDSVQSVVQWRWNPLLPQPARSLSKLIGSNLKYLTQEVYRRIEPNVPLDMFNEILPSNLLPPEEFLVQKETIKEELARLHMSAEDLFLLEDQRRIIDNNRFINKNSFPIHVPQPNAIWCLLAELNSKERLAVLYSLGYVFFGQTTDQVGKHIGLHDGHMKAILHGARQKITSMWETDAYEKREYSIVEIQQLIEDALHKGTEVNILRNGTIDRSKIRQELREVLDTLGEKSVNFLPIKRARVVDALLDGYMASEVGEQLGISRKTVVDHATKALIQLRARERQVVLASE